MHQGTLAAHDQLARERIAAAVQALAERVGLHLEAGEITGAQGRDRLIRGLRQKEAVANALEQILATGDKLQPAPAVEPTPEPEPTPRRKRGAQHGVSE